MATLTSTIINAKSKVMRTAWHLYRTTGINFSDSLRKAWKILKDAFAKIELEKGMCFRDGKVQVYKKVARDAKEINKEMTANIVFLVNHFKTAAELDRKASEREIQKAAIIASNPAIIAEHLIYNTRLD